MSATNTPATDEAAPVVPAMEQRAAEPAPYTAPQFIPIQLDISYNHLRLKDAFLWNKDDASVTVEEFARRLCEDLDFPPQIFVPPVVRSMRAQIEFYSSDPASKKEDSNGDENTNNKREDIGEKRYLIKVINQ